VTVTVHGRSSAVLIARERRICGRSLRAADDIRRPPCAERDPPGLCRDQLAAAAFTVSVPWPTDIGASPQAGTW